MKKLQELFHTLTTSDKFWLLLVAGVTFAAFAPSLAFKEMISDDNYYYLTSTIPVTMTAIMYADSNAPATRFIIPR